MRLIAVLNFTLLILLGGSATTRATLLPQNGWPRVWPSTRGGGTKVRKLVHGQPLIATSWRGGSQEFDNEDNDEENDDESDDTVEEEIESSDSDTDNEEEAEDEESNVAASTNATTINNKKATNQPSHRLVRSFLNVMFSDAMRDAMFALFITLLFRKQLVPIIQQLIQSFFPNQTGDQTANPERPSSRSTITTLVLIIMLALYLRKPQSSPLLSVMMAKTAGIPPFITALLYILMTPANTAYIPPVEQHYSFEVLNTRYQKDAQALEKVLDGVNSLWNITFHGFNATSGPRNFLATLSGQSQRFTKHTKSVDKLPANAPTVVVLEMTGLDTTLSQLDTIRDKISFLLSQHRERVMTPRSAQLVAGRQSNSDATNNTNKSTADSTNITSLSLAIDREQNANASSAMPLEVVVVLESGGGSAAEYSLAAQQLLRLRRETGVTLTIIVDKLAASGGYMMACTSSPGQLFASPLAVLGSIGVVGQTLNFYETLQSYGVESLTFRAGRAKAPLTATSEITREGMAVVQGMLDDVHRAFQAHVAESRPVLAHLITELATGEIWLGRDALQVGLIDGIMTRYADDAMDCGISLTLLLCFSTLTTIQCLPIRTQ